MCAHKLEIEKSRYFQINRTERFCNICNDLEIEDAENWISKNFFLKIYKQ
jgi:hypothetical protein